MRFCILDVMDKGLYLRTRLEEAGHIAGSLDDADLLLVDCDWEWASPRPELIKQAVEKGAKVAVYPHGGQPTMFVYDGLTAIDDRVDLRLEHGPRNPELARHLGLELKQQAFGWLYSPTKEFLPVSKAKRVLFAPQHPNLEARNNGGGPDSGPVINNGVYRDLLRLGYEVKVSVVGPLWWNGIWPHPRARMLANPQMRLTLALEQIAQADVVIAAGTLAAAAVALGKPTVFLEEHDCSDYLNHEYRAADHADDYRDLFRYPLVAGNGPLEDLITVACQGTEATRIWREWWIGDDGTAEAVRHLGHLWGESSRRDVQIQGVTARASLGAN